MSRAVASRLRRLLAVSLICVGLFNLSLVSLLSRETLLLLLVRLRHKLMWHGSPPLDAGGRNPGETTEDDVGAPVALVNATALPRVDIWIMTSHFFGAGRGGAAEAVEMQLA